MVEDPTTGEAKRGYFEVVAVTSHTEDEILQITIEAEPGSRGAEEQGSNSLDSGSDTIDNTDSQLNSDDDQSPNLQSPHLLHVTPEHPIYVEGKGWLNAENLSIGDRLRRSDGGLAWVLALERVALDEPEVVYNFTVKGPHTYFVLEAGVLVHNAGPYPGCELPEDSPRIGSGLIYDPQKTEEIFKVLDETEEGRELIAKICYRIPPEFDKNEKRFLSDQDNMFKRVGRG